ncbi:ADP-ribosylation factor GTPase-activating protein AGD3, partial [Zea mays]
MRDLSSFVETRQQLLSLKPNHRMNWIGFAVAHHLNSDSSKAVEVLEAYEGTLEDDYPPENERYEHNDMLLYKYDRHFAAKYELGKEMTTTISIEDVRREVKILKALSGHSNPVKFYDACEDALNVYIIMEYVFLPSLCIILIYVKTVNIACAVYLETTCMIVLKSRIVYLRVDVLLQHINIIYGSRPFWAQTESGIFRLVLRAHPNFDDSPWQSVSPEAKDFVKRLLNKDYRKRMTAAQALLVGRGDLCMSPVEFEPSVSDDLVLEKKSGNGQHDVRGTHHHRTSMKPEKPIDLLRKVDGNNMCANCGASEPDWASLNPGALLCIECSGVHRNLGVHISKVRSLTLDVRVWEPSVINLFQSLSNMFVNSIWEETLPDDNSSNSMSIALQ